MCTKDRVRIGERMGMLVTARKLCDTPGCTKSTHLTTSRSRSLRAEGSCEIAGREVVQWTEDLDTGIWSAVVSDMLVTVQKTDGYQVQVTVYGHPVDGAQIAQATIETRWVEVGQEAAEALALALKGKVLR